MAMKRFALRLLSIIVVIEIYNWIVTANIQFEKDKNDFSNILS